MLSRLFNELALNNITNKKDANKFLVKFEKDFNKRFAFDFKMFNNSFTPWNRTKEELSYYLSTQYIKVIDNGSSFSLDCNRYCLIDDKRFFQNPFLHAACSFESGHKSDGFFGKCFFSRREKTLIHTVFAVFSKNALIQNRLRIVLKWVLKKPHKYKTVLIPSKIR